MTTVWVIEHKPWKPICSADRDWAPRFSAGVFRFRWEVREKLEELKSGNKQMKFRAKAYAPFIAAESKGEP